MTPFEEMRDCMAWSNWLESERVFWEDLDTARVLAGLAPALVQEREPFSEAVGKASRSEQSAPTHLAAEEPVPVQWATIGDGANHGLFG